MDLPKFINMLEEGSLYFSRLDLLDDTFEGKYSRKSFDTIRNLKEYKDNKINTDFVIHYLHCNMSKVFFVNCWHINKYESIAMWDLYTSSEYGICIKSKFQNLLESIDDPEDSIRYGPVSYIDYETETIPMNALSPIFFKRKSYSYENELRIITDLLPIAIPYNPSIYKSRGQHVKVDLNLLVMEIMISPKAPAWFKETVQSLIKKYKLDFPVCDSCLNKEPHLIFEET